MLLNTHYYASVTCQGLPSTPSVRPLASVGVALYNVLEKIRFLHIHCHFVGH